MEISTIVDKSRKLRIHTVTGHLTKENLFAKLLEMYSSTEFQANMNALWDVRTTDLSSVILSDVVEACDFIQDQWRGNRTIMVAFVVGSDVDFTLATMYETLSKENPKFKICVFRDIAKAKNWLTASGLEENC